MSREIDVIKYNLKELQPVRIDPANERIFLQIKNDVAGLMSENVGVVRNREGLETARRKLREILSRYSGHSDEYNLLKIKNVATVGLLITEGALSREESRGGHIRDDFKEQNPKFRVHTIQKTETDLSFEEVRNKKL